ncbi:PP2C family protein-serine/threonine phosphatase [Streptomyces sp. NPDC058372]|uniref:PP2C family protein-serine/threonine phosphatase n=1 Tax=unclassified Streptomyces TaxID=2593676 RepID=UPI003664CD5C
MRRVQGDATTLTRPGRAGDRPLPWLRGRHAVWALPALLLVLIVFGDLWTGTDFRMIAWVVMVPALTAALAGVGATVVFSVLSLLAYLLVDGVLSPGPETGLPGLLLLVAASVVSVAACGVRQANERRARRLSLAADVVRDTVLRPLPFHWGGLDWSALYVTADHVARVGGDFYDLQPSPHGTRVVLGDVQGKGLGAVAAAAVLLGTFREAGYHEGRLRDVARRLETRMKRQQVYSRFLGQDEGDRFATAVVLSFDPVEPGTVRSGTSGLDLVTLGHEPPLAVGPDGVRPLPSSDGVPLGMGELACDVPEDGGPRIVRGGLEPGETLLLFTDGVTEARDRHGAFYSLHEDLARAVVEDPGLARPDRLVRYVRDAVERHVSGSRWEADDLTVLALKPLPVEPQREEFP